MASTPRTPLGGETLNRKWYLDLNTGTYASPVWTPVNGIVDFQPTFDPTMQDDSDFDSGGAKSVVATAYTWGAALKVARKVTVADATVYDTGQEAIRAAAAQLGLGNVLDIRYFEVTSGGPKAEAYRGYVVANWTEDGGAMDALDTVSVVLNGKGARTAITHPDAAGAVPVIYSLDEATGSTSGGGVILITGSGFTGTLEVGDDGVMFGATEASDWKVIDDHHIVAEIPAHAGGAVNVTVENATGASVSTATFTYS